MRFRPVVRIGLASIAVSFGCGSVLTVDPDGAADPGPDGGTGSMADGASDPPADAGPTVYGGMLGATPPVVFGGDPFCEYTITLEEVGVEVELLPSGEVGSAGVQDLSVEDKVPPCKLGTIPPGIQTYTLASQAPSNGGVTLMLLGAATNDPMTTLAIELSLEGPLYRADLAWKRTDQPPPLDWEVRATMILSAATD